jgi:hypothetical protein
MGLATDAMVPSHHTGVRSISIRGIPRDRQALSLTKTPKADNTLELDDLQDIEDEKLERKTEEF